MKTKKITKTPCGQIKDLENGLVKIIQEYDDSATVDDAREYIRLLKQHVEGQPSKFLIDIRSLRKTSNAKVMRGYFSTEEANECNAATAILVNSGVSKILGNFFIRAKKQPYPIKLFTKDTAAIDWLKSL